MSSKKNKLKELTGILIFLIILFSSVLILRPLYFTMSNLMDNAFRSKILEFEEKFGINISYESLSPSIFSGLQIEGISIVDAKNDYGVLEIKKAFLRYNFFKLFSGKFSEALKDLTVDGITLSYFEDGGSDFIQRLKQNSKQENVPKKEKSERAFNLEQIASKVPFDIFIKNVHLQYSTDTKILDVFMKRLNLNRLSNLQNAVLVKTSGSVMYNDSVSLKNYSAVFSSDGTVFENLEGSSVILRLSDMTDGNFKFNRLNMRFGYAGRKCDFRTIQNAYPFYVSGSYNIDTNDVKLSFSSENLNPGQLFYTRHSTKLMETLRNLSLGVKVNLDYNPVTGTFAYSSNGKIDVSKKIISGGLSFDYALNGDQKQINVKHADATGERLNGAFSGNLQYAGLRFQGVLDIYNYTLQNGGVVSTELYFDPLENGFMCFAPQLMLDDHALTALELKVIPVKDSVDFSLELSDYSHTESEIPGNLKLNGSYITDSKYIQANVASTGMFLDSLCKTGVFFGKEKNNSDFKFLSSYMTNAEMYFSSDLKTYSFNVPYVVIANTKKDNQLIYLSLDGNENTVQVSRFDFVSNGEMLTSSLLFEKNPDSSDAFFIADTSFGAIPYHFTGNIMQNVVSISGDYGLSFELHKSSGKRLDGSATLESLPVEIKSVLVTFSLDSVFSFSPDQGLELHVSRFVVDETGGPFSVNPHAEFSGTVSKYGAFFDRVIYTDRYSEMAGKSELLWNVNDGIFDSVAFNFNLDDIKGSEKLSVHADFSNPMQLEFSRDLLKKSLYLSSQISLESFNLNRFSTELNADNVANITISASGTMENPFVGINVAKLQFINGKKNVYLNGSCYVEEKNLTLDNCFLRYNSYEISDIKADFDLNTFSGRLDAVLDSIVMKKTVHAPLYFTVSDTYIPEKKLLPTEFALNLSLPEISGTFIKKKFPFELTVLKSEENSVFYTNEEIGLQGSVTQSGKIDFSIPEGRSVSFDATGRTNGSELNVSINKIAGNLGEIWSYIDVQKFTIFKGMLEGDLRITGYKKDPDFNGTLVVNGFEFNLPTFVPSHCTIPKVTGLMNHQVLEVPEVRGLIKNMYPIYGEAQVYFDRWSFDRVESRVHTPKKVFAPADVNLRLVEFIGDASIDLNLLFQDRYLDITGDVSVKNTTARVKTKEVAQMNPPPKRKIFVRSDLDINLVQHCSFRFDPLLRAVFIPDTKFGFKYDMEAADYQIDGDINMRSGDIAYLSRSFYLKNGTMKFNKNETSFNPLITLTAETREKDDLGNDVRIVLSVNNQYLLDFEPQFSSIPAKSENEIRTMLGQIAVGDSNNVSSFLAATGEYALQSTVGRSVENKLRDFFNFDILSIRTSVLQNALKQSLARNDSESQKNNQGIGNYLDNSTVYIGKYFGSALYADALLHWSYDDSRIEDKSTIDGLVFKPEIGLEMESPFANIRWTTAPDIDALMNNKLVSSTSVTLSWKFSF